jgi:hypothetical protein
MNDSLKKIKATLESTLDSSKLLSEKDPIASIQAKEPKNEFLKQTGADFAPRQAGRDWWWCDDL